MYSPRRPTHLSGAGPGVGLLKSRLKQQNQKMIFSTNILLNWKQVSMYQLANLWTEGQGLSSEPRASEYSTLITYYLRFKVRLSLKASENIDKWEAIWVKNLLDSPPQSFKAISLTVYDVFNLFSEKQLVCLIISSIDVIFNTITSL